MLSTNKREVRGLLGVNSHSESASARTRYGTVSPLCFFMRLDPRWALGNRPIVELGGQPEWDRPAFDLDFAPITPLRCSMRLDPAYVLLLALSHFTSFHVLSNRPSPRR